MGLRAVSGALPSGCLCPNGDALTHQLFQGREASRCQRGPWSLVWVGREGKAPQDSQTLCTHTHGAVKAGSSAQPCCRILSLKTWRMWQVPCVA